MKRAVHIRATAELAPRYRKLLLGTWSGGLKHALAVISLLRGELEAGGLAVRFHWEVPLRPARREPRKVYSIPATGSASLREFLERANAQAMEPLPEVEMPPQPLEVDKVAEEAWTLLTLQADFDLRDDTGLFRDTQSLLFLSACHDILPEVRSAGRHARHALLAEALRWHASAVWADQPAHAHHLLARLFESLGQAELSQAYLYSALQLTPKTEHDYLSRAQAYWTSLMDTGHVNRARSLALNLYRDALPEALPEIEQLVALSYASRSVSA